MFHLSREPMALLGLDARFWDVNQALADMVQLQPQQARRPLMLQPLLSYTPQLCCGISLLSLILPEDLDVFLHHARSLLSAGDSDGVGPCHAKFPCRMRSNDDSVIDIEFDLHMLRRSASPYCFALYLRSKAAKSEAAPAVAAASAAAAPLDASSMSLNPGMFLLEQLQQQQQLASAGTPQYMIAGLQQQDSHAASMFMLGDFQHHQQQPGMFLPISSTDSAQHSAAFS
jgi:hypothetical protein